MKRVYAIQSEAGLVKIGVSGNPSKRLGQLAFAAPAKLALSFATDVRQDANAVERAAHAILAEKRRHGEWFDVTAQEAEQAIRDAIEDLDARSDGARAGTDFAANLTWISALRRLRKHLGMTQEALADAIGISRRQLNQYERAKAPIPRQTMLAVLGLCLGQAMLADKKV